ncbi:MAG TPA: hypothetical protein VKE40_00140 [Gemmataceae bacterium]|nr:hypothetical protein [Gemmataceae bacterium]
MVHPLDLDGRAVGRVAVASLRFGLRRHPTHRPAVKVECDRLGNLSYGPLVVAW